MSFAKPNIASLKSISPFVGTQKWAAVMTKIELLSCDNTKPDADDPLTGAHTSGSSQLIIGVSSFNRKTKFSDPTL